MGRGCRVSTPFRTEWSYGDFHKEVTETRRFVLTSHAQGFLEAVKATCNSRASFLAQGTILWRAQHGCDWEMKDGLRKPVPYDRSRMKPLVGKAHEGRVNPKGISCLYAAQSARVALGEVRPWIGSIVSMARLKTARRLRVVDCSKDEASLAVFRDQLTDRELEKAVWGDINNAFSEPVVRSDDTADYAATQVIAELFKTRGFDGVIYRSSFGTAHRNVALFDPGAADVTSVDLQTVKTIRIEPVERASPHFVKTVGALQSAGTSIQTR